MNYLRFLRREGDKVTCGSRVEVGMQDPCHSVTSFLVWKWCGSGFLSSGLRFTALNYSHSVVPNKKKQTNKLKTIGITGVYEFKLP